MVTGGVLISKKDDRRYIPIMWTTLGCPQSFYLTYVNTYITYTNQYNYWYYVIHAERNIPS